MSYKYGNTFKSTNGPIYSFDDFVEWQYRMNVPRCRVVIGNEGHVGYYPDMLYVGEEYFIGKQHRHWNDEKEMYPWGVYKMVGYGDVLEDVIIFEDKNGKRIEVRPGTVILKKNRIIRAQIDYGFWYPSEVRNGWPDLVENPVNMPKPEYITCVPNKPGVRGWIDSILATIFWIFGLLMFNAGRGGEFSFNFWGSTFYYLWLVVGGIFLLGHFWTRKK